MLINLIMFLQNFYILFYNQSNLYLTNVYNLLFLDNYYNTAFKFFEIIPEISLFCLILFNLIQLLYSNIQKQFKQWLNYFVFLFFLYLFKFYIYVCIYNGIFVLFNFCWISNFYILLSKLLILSMVVVYLIIIKFSIQKCNKNIIIEFCWLISITIFFLFALLNSYNFFFAYINIEGLSLILYVLSCCVSNNYVSKESAFKYLALSSIASGLLLMGIIWFYIVVQSLNFNSINYYFLQINYLNLCELHLQLAIIFILLAFLFKIGAFPCYYWIPDVYVGIWTPITFFFSTITKLSLFLFFFKFIYNINYNMIFFWKNFLFFSSLGSILTGAFGAIYQTNLKKFIAYASLNQTGFILLGLTTGNIYGLKSSLIFLFIYTIMNLIFFGIILNTINLITGRNIYYLNDIVGISYHNPFNCLIFTGCIFSMAGIPPFAGFFTKFYIFFSFFKSNCFTVGNYNPLYNVFFILILSLLSSYYYINIIKQLFFEKNNNNNNFFWFLQNRLLIIILNTLFLILTLWIFIFNKTSYFFELTTIACIAPLLTTFTIIY